MMSTSSTDRNLLLGLLALQMGLVTRDQLVAAFSVWVINKQVGLNQILLEQGALQSRTHALLDALTAEHLKMHGDDPQQSLAAVSSAASACDELQRLADVDLNASLALVSILQPGQDPYGATLIGSVGEATSAGTRFRILRPHARGGLGQVSVALDEELHREVALKEIQSLRSRSC